MRRFIVTLGALALVLAVQAGCKKDDPAPAAQGEAEKTAEAAKKAGAEAAEAAKEAGEEAAAAAKEAGAEAAKAAEEAGAAAKAAAEKTAEANPQPTPSDSPAAAVPDKLPAPAAVGGADLPIEDAKLDQLVKYSEEMATILEENATDPAAAAKKLEEYLGANKDEREALLAEFEGLKEKLTPEQQTALGMKLLSKLGPLMQRMQKLFQEHPELASDPKIQEAMTPFKK